jgi:hypothetical protein
MQVSINLDGMRCILNDFHANTVQQLLWIDMGLKYVSFSLLDLKYIFEIVDTNAVIFFLLKYSFVHEKC